MASRSIFDLHPLLAYALGKAESEWLLTNPTAPKPFLVATHRSNQEQQALYDQPRDRKDNDGDGRIDEKDEFVTNARAGQSPHNYLPSFAFDIAFRNSKGATDYNAKWFDDFARLVLKTPGVTWGGNFSSLIDRPHFELADWEKLIKK